VTDGSGDRAWAAREAAARETLLGEGAGSLPRPPWRHPMQPPSAVDLVQYAVWRAGTGAAGETALLAAVSLVQAAHAEVDQLETAVLFAARAGGLSWSQISRELGLGSAQAAQQRFDRVTARVERRDGGA
jgi:hypothetical protein